ncbi:ABC transporter ATP-binding protein [Actinoallomurus vinaceus]|uniref:ABC transporter ATP-binding protein n=1 Tax=Actinoallomurus vinaceus TaxID=1080074 RepID=A0ABP8UUZ0_9ACTN
MRHLPLDRGRRWLSIARLLPLAGRPALLSSVLVNLTIGLLPVGFIVGTSVMLTRVPALAAVRHGPDAWPGVLSAFALAIGALVLQNMLSPLQAAFGELVTRRIDGHCMRRLMTACLADAPMTLLEQREVIDDLSLARQGLLERSQTPGAAAAGLLALIARYVQVIGAVILVGLVLGPSAGVMIGLVAAVVRAGSRGALTRWSLVIRRRFAGTQRRMRYVLDTGSDPAVAKEVRVLGILPWLRARAESESGSFLASWWRERRRIYFTPFLVFTLVALVGTVAVLLELRAAAGGVSVLGLSLAVQSILVPLRMGTFFPESDLQTMYGMQAYDTITDLEERFRTGARRTGPAVARTTLETSPVQELPAKAIRFEDVRFRYPDGDRDVLCGLDLELPVGTSTAIVGLNGAGKTTLIKLLARLYEPTGGLITVDGADLRDIDPRAWQRRLAMIFQDYVRYELDAAANIGMGAPDHIGDEAALRAASEWAGAADVLDTLPAHLATPLSSRYARGVDLSGGQWQRIALARALFAVGAGASVLVLDEPTAQLDVRAEVAFFDRFIELTEGLTTIVISHRFSTVRRADRIVVLDEGRVAEEGDHDELLRGDGGYAELFRLQAHRFFTDGLPGSEAMR